MKKLEIYLNYNLYERIKNYIDWTNLDNYIEMKLNDYTVEEYIVGLLESQIELIDKLISNQSEGLNENSKFKNNFKTIAKERGVRQVDICKKLNLKKSYLSLVFNNKHQPNTELFFKIWVLLKCPPIHQCLYFED